MPSTPEYRPDADTLARYHAGTLPEAEAAALERAAEQDAFLAAALEGSASLSAGATEALQARITAQNTRFARQWWWAGGVAAAAIVTLLMWPQEEPLVTEASPVITTAPATTQSPEPLGPEAVAPQVVQRSRTDSSVSVTVKVPSLPEATPAAAEPNPETFRLVEIMLEDEMRELEPELFAAAEPENTAPAAPEHSVYEIARYRVVDYSGQRTQKLERDMPDPRSLSPQFSQREDLDDPLNQVNRPATVSYEEALELAVGHYAAARHRIALWHFEDILKVYPDDVNAQFYGGMSAWHDNRFKDARDLLRQAASNDFNTFAEAAAFYAAQALFAFGDPAQARTELKAIADAGGFYAERAKLELGID